MKMLTRNFFNAMLILVLAIGNVVLVPTAAAERVYGDRHEASGGTMLLDTAIVRPVMLVTTAVGIVAFVVSSPFSVLGGNVEQAAETLVKEPAEHLLFRPLGEF